MSSLAYIPRIRVEVVNWMLKYYPAFETIKVKRDFSPSNYILINIVAINY